MGKLNYHYEQSLLISASPKDVFNYVDDHSRFSSHMSKSTWMMGGSKMEIQVDEGKGQRIGSHIRMKGKVFGITIFLDEVVTKHQLPHRKVWETVGNPQLLVIGNYEMGVEITPENGKSQLKIFINYELPDKNKWLGYLLGGIYAKWCVKQMADGVREHFND